MTVFADAGAFVREQVVGAGYTVGLLMRSLAALVAIPKRVRFILDQMFVTGVRPLPVTLFVAVFAGMILSLQTGIELRSTGTHTMIGNIIALSMCREMGPFITAVILAATVGSRMAAELGTMNVSEEITALEVMSIDPVRFLVMPRVVALALMCPALTVFSNLVGILGGSLIAQVHLDISFPFYMNSVRESLSSQVGLLPKDVWVGIFKAFIFGVTIAVVGCASGLRARGGALGVGQAVQTAVRNSILLIIVLGYIVTWFFFYFIVEA